jgi:hypothetical protein
MRTEDKTLGICLYRMRIDGTRELHHILSAPSIRSIKFRIKMDSLIYYLFPSVGQRLSLTHLPIGAPLSKQTPVISFLHNAALMHNKDHICLLDSR